MAKFLLLFVIGLCGTHATSLKAEVADRMINGWIAQENQFLYTVSLQRLSEIQNYTRGHRCGGALVTLQHVVTAASCVVDNVNGASVVIDPAEYRVFAGSVDLTNDDSENRYRSIKNITLHPEYSTFVNDIAIITLVSKFNSTTVRLVSLPTTDARPTDLVPCFVSGWGAQNSTATASTRLLYVLKRVNEQTLCRAYYGSLAVNQINIVESMICAWTVVVPFSGCTGDIGNPLVCDGNINGILVRSKNCTASLEPEVYTRISSYRTWINSVTTSPDGANTIKPAMAVLALFVIAQTISANVLS